MSNLVMKINKIEKKLLIAEASLDAVKELTTDGITDSNEKARRKSEITKLIKQRTEEFDEARRQLEQTSREMRVFRRDIRKRLFKIRQAVLHGQNTDSEYDGGLKAWIDVQLNQQADLTWVKVDKSNRQVVGGFTFEWDISAKEPLKVIRQFAWDGQIERRLVPEMITGADKVQRHSGRYLQVDACDPAAFTRQS
jgi:hypothetical protein